MGVHTGCKNTRRRKIVKSPILTILRIKPGLHISREDRWHRLENMFFKLSSNGLVFMWRWVVMIVFEIFHVFLN